ncbi:MAG: hypothetical protein DMG34_16995 [Acidobacteria bacterium]|nr:MAG: hypothetical protein DMG34_16995 [Acidobacteriota bacterium]
MNFLWSQSRLLSTATSGGIGGSKLRSDWDARTRVSELSVNGCYIDEQNPFPSGTIVTLKIFSESEVFDATAKVLYAHPNLGMGLVFQEVSLRSDAVLREWLRAAKALEEKSHS